MAAAANYAWVSSSFLQNHEIIKVQSVNRSSMTFLVRQAFAKMFETTPDDLDMHVIYDVSHNIAKVDHYS